MEGSHLKPQRFSKVTETIFRVAYPEEGQLRWLVENYNIQTIICLRRNPVAVAKESKLCKELGIRFIWHPFTGFFEKHPRFFDQIISELGTAEFGNIYIHCTHGKDRTSLIVCLFLVVTYGFDRKEIWKKWATNFDHIPNSWVYRKFLPLYNGYLNHTQKKLTA